MLELSRPGFLLCDVGLNPLILYHVKGRSPRASHRLDQRESARTDFLSLLSRGVVLHDRAHSPGESSQHSIQLSALNSRTPYSVGSKNRDAKDTTTLFLCSDPKQLAWSRHPRQWRMDDVVCLILLQITPNLSLEGRYWPELLRSFTVDKE